MSGPTPATEPIPPSSARWLPAVAALALVAAAGLGTALETSVPAIKAEPSDRYQGAWGLGVNGTGSTVAVVDTGVDDSVEAFGDAFVAGADFVGDAVPSSDETPGCQDGSPVNPDDTDGHGTHVAGIALSRGTEYIPEGVAPGAGLVDLKIARNFTGLSNRTLLNEAIRWTVQYNRGETCYGDPGRDRIDVVSISFGGFGPGHTNTSTTFAIENATDAGLAVVISAGNCGRSDVPGASCSGQSGDRNTVTSPGLAPDAITVGAVDEQDTVDRSDDRVASYSSRGPGGADNATERKPNVVAPGSGIESVCNEESAEYIYSFTCRKSGTSMAAPHVSAVVALLEEAADGIRPDRAKAVLEGTALDGGADGWDRAWGWGEVDARAAVEEVHVADDQPNRAPTAQASVTPRTGTTNTTFAFDGSASSDPDGDALAYTWSVPGRGEVNGQQVEVSFDEAGNRTAKLTVRDPSGATDDEDVTVHVEPESGGSEGGFEDGAGGNGTEGGTGGNATGDGAGGNATDDDTGGDGPDGTSSGGNATDPDDGTGSGDGSTAEGNATAGEGSGDGSGSSSGNRRPTADLVVSPSQARVGEQVRFDASGSRDPDGSVATVLWDLGGGPAPEWSTDELGVNKTFRTPGRHQVRMVAVDDDGAASDPTSVTVTVEGRPPSGGDESGSQARNGAGTGDGGTDASDRGNGTPRGAPGPGPMLAALAGTAAALARAARRS